MVIGGESLLNDGSAMVVWSIFFYLAIGYEFDVTSKIAVLVIGSPVIGFAFGVVWRLWLAQFSSPLDHTNGVTQTALTVAGAYSCFYVSEGFAGGSGVMSVVVMGGVLAGTFWPVLADPQMLTGTWHTLEWTRLPQVEGRTRPWDSAARGGGGASGIAESRPARTVGCRGRSM